MVMPLAFLVGCLTVGMRLNGVLGHQLRGVEDPNPKNLIRVMPAEGREATQACPPP